MAVLKHPALMGFGGTGISEAAEGVSTWKDSDAENFRSL